MFQRIQLERRRGCLAVGPTLSSRDPSVEVMQRIATPMIGGVVTSTVMELAVYPVIFYLWRSRRLQSR